jgi:WD40 repeat protein
MELKHAYSFTGHSANVKAVIGLPDGRVASAGFDTTVRIWNPRTWRQDTSIPLNTTPFCLAVLDDGSLVVGCGDHAVYVLAIDGVRVTRKHVMTGHDAPVFSVCTFRDEAGRELVASGSRDKTIRLWDPRKGEPVGAVLMGHEDTVGGLMSLSEALLVSCSTDATIRVWDLATMASVLTLRGHSKAVVALSGLSWGGGGSRIASGSEDGTIRIWDLMTGACESILDGRDPSAPPGTHVTVWALTLLPNDFLVSGGDDGVLRVWDVSAGGCVASQRSKDGAIHCLDLLPRPRAAVALVPAPTAVAAAAAAGTGATASASPPPASSPAAATPAAPGVASASAAADGTGTLITANFAEFSVGLFRVPAAAMIPHLSSAPRVRLNRRSLLGSGGRTPSRGESGTLSHDGSSGSVGGASGGGSSGSLMAALRSEASVSLFGSLTAPTPAAAGAFEGGTGAGGGKKPLRHGDIPTAVSGGAVSSRRFRTSTTDAGDGGMGGDCSRDDAGDGTAPRGKRASQLGAGVGAAAGPGGVRVADSAERDVVFSFDDPAAEGADAAAAAAAAASESAVTEAAGNAGAAARGDAGNTDGSATAPSAAAAAGVAAVESQIR